jgi:translation initiation factor IF-2
LRKLAEIPKDLMQGGAYKLEDIARATLARVQVGATTAPVIVDDEEEDAKGKGKGGAAKKPGGVTGRADRHKERSDRQMRRKVDEALLDMTDDEATAARARLRRHKKQRGSMPRKGKIPIELPITIRSLSEAMGVKSAELLMKLMSQGMGAGKNINSSIDPELAETIALEYGAELDVKQKLDVEDALIAKLRKPDDPAKLLPRAPIVTIMGHVDHGKTSLLDCIRKSKVVDTEAGGITQVIRAWRVDIHGKPITFLDTPGHEAFTKMRARGANVTDIVVIVVAADDGVMPQTEEAINHAKAADVKIVVAINKVDLPNANIRRTEQQLYGMGLIPDSMGGDVQFIQTSASTGQGVEELLETLALVAEVEELKANPSKPATGVCLEANISEGQGVIATIIVQEGTLKRGDIVLCGAAYGRVRALYDDHNKQIQEAGPSMPVRLLGLDEVPNADDPFLVVPELSVARDISEKRKQSANESSQHRRQSLSFDNLGMGPVNELKVVLKADFRGSLEAIRKEIEKLQHDEVKVRVLHTGVGAITEGDIQLALTSPNDTMVLGFNAEPDNRALALSEERGIPIRTYSIIYKLTEDVKAALEGRLKPKEEVIRLGRAVIREVFKVTRVGSIAGCVVTQGTIERSAKVRVIRSGVVVYPPAERTASLESLKRFKDDVREVREGYECGMKIAGYDDIKVDDVIEAFKIEQIKRTLD